jgi:hypothetical protein
VRPASGIVAASTWPTLLGLGATLRASTATYSAAAPSRYQSASAKTSVPTAGPVAPQPSAATTPETSWQGMTGVRSWPERSTQVEGHVSSPGV